MDLNGEIKILNKDQIKFFYRGTSLNKNFIILSVILLGKKSSKQIIRSKVENLINKKKNSQPSRIKTCGSTFKNPINQKALQLIKLSNCKDLKIGGAKISPQHCNFFLNDGNATSSDIENLIQKVKSEVLEKTGVNLELELKIVGRK